MSVSACAHRCAQHEINDIGLVAVEKDGVVGYDVWVGGGLGASARMGRRLDVFVAPDEAVEVCRAITELFRDEGKRTKRTRARIKFLVDEWGVERFRAEVEDRLRRELPTSVDPGQPIDPHRDHLGIHPQARARPLLRRRHHAARPVPGRPDDRRRRHRRPLRLGRSCAAPTART